jgi:hypothetical protein
MQNRGNRGSGFAAGLSRPGAPRRVITGPAGETEILGAAQFLKKRSAAMPGSQRLSARMQPLIAMARPKNPFGYGLCGRLPKCKWPSPKMASTCIESLCTDPQSLQIARNSRCSQALV